MPLSIEIGMSLDKGTGGGGSSYTPALVFSDARNSQYFFLLFVW
jgi:hypothetical protein